MSNIKFLLEKITRAGDDCGCSPPCQCYGREWEDATMDGMKDLAHRALDLLEKEEQEMNECEELLIGNDQEIDFVKPIIAPSGSYAREIKAVTSLVDDELLGVLEDVGAIIAGGAFTSVFTNKEVNDIDVYLPSAEAFTMVLRSLYGEAYEDDARYSCGFKGGTVTHYGKKTLTVMSRNVKVQFVVYKWHKDVESIFNDFDFTINMAALNLKTKQLTLHPEFLRHLALRYLSFNSNTAYPLISALRVNKYHERGYSISKAQMLRVLMAVNKKNIDSWEILCEELGGMYGMDAENLLDTTKKFSMDDALEQLDKIDVIPEKMFKNQSFLLEDIFEHFKDRIDVNYYNWRKTRENAWSKDYKPYDPNVVYNAPEQEETEDKDEF